MSEHARLGLVSVRGPDQLCFTGDRTCRSSLLCLPSAFNICFSSIICCNLSSNLAKSALAFLVS